jgi:hypothetical protein
MELGKPRQSLTGIVGAGIERALTDIGSLLGCPARIAG